MTTQTLIAPLGGEVYQELFDRQGNRITLTYNDLWMLIVCRTGLEGDWIRTRQLAMMTTDAVGKQEIAQRLWELDQILGGLPEIPRRVQKLHLHRAHQWFKSRPVIHQCQ